MEKSKNVFIDDKESFDSNRLERKFFFGRTVVCFLLIFVLLFASGVTTIYFNVMKSFNTFTDADIESSRVSGDELANLDAEFADNTITESDAGLPTDYLVSTDDVSIILLIGSDSRFGINRNARSDSIMLLAIDRKHQKIKLISIMRDLYAIIPNYKNNRINTAFYYDCRYNNLDLKITFNTIEQNLGVKTDDYVVIDFSGFKKIIDLLGGITIEFNAEEAKYMWSDPDYGNFPRFKAGAGEYNCNGAEALNYCRMRHVSGGDFGRTDRQRKVITLMVNKLMNSDISTLYSVATSCLEFVSTNIPQNEINGYVMEAVDILKYDIEQLRIPIEGSYGYRMVYSGTTPMSVLWPNYKWNSQQLKKFIFEDDMTYANGAKAKNVTIPAMPYGTITSLPSESTDVTDTTDATDTTGTTASTKPSAEPTSSTAKPSTEATTTTTTTVATKPVTSASQETA
ncbi:MAG: LCP family protein [Clostridia bacterium]|nr:LCP family protein [Clostridia bacterium]